MPSPTPDDLVPYDPGYISSDSSFYGSPTLRAQLAARSATPISSALPPPSLHLTSLANHNVATRPAAAKEPYNPYADQASARQLSETVADFTHRLPPSTTSLRNHGPWLYLANPHSLYRPTTQNPARLTAVGGAILADLSSRIRAIEATMAGKAPGSITRKLTPLRTVATQGILNAAKEAAYMSGKWMLFPDREDVDRVWALVATGTAEGVLGSAVKVATADGGNEGGARLVCVYTEDFSDRKGVRRVVEGLVAMGLVGAKEDRLIYYKCDAFTHLGIDRNNEWGLKPSLYSSKEVLAWDVGTLG